MKAVLVYGPDSGRVRETAERIVRSVAGSLDEPFTVTTLTDDRLAADPALLIDEARSLAFTGGRRVVWIGQAGGGFRQAIEAYFADPGGDALIVAEAGILAKTAKLRNLFEAAGNAAIIACYEDSPEDLRTLILRSVSGSGLRMDEDTVELLIDRIGSDRGLSRGEIDKLLLYCHGRESISVDDVEAACGDVSASTLDNLIDAAFSGEADEACRRFFQLIDSGSLPASILSALGSHLARLLDWQLEIAAGKAPSAVVRGARPPMPPPRQSSVTRQLEAWDAPALDEAVRVVLDATRQARDLPALASPIAERAVLAISRKSLTLRSRRSGGRG